MEQIRMKRKPNHKRTEKRISAHLEKINLYAAGIDIGSTSHFVAVPEDLDDQPVREFSCFTGDLHRMADWLVEIGIQTVAMESTGVYWIPAYEILEERGLEVLLVNARHVKHVPGRKSDVQDCQWLQQLHTYGLLEGAFRPPEEGVVLRSYMRQRGTLVQRASDHIRHMQKALRQMNLLLDNVVTDITGKTGMAIIHAILEGRRDPVELAKLRDKRCKHDHRTIAASLEGHYREDHLFSLKQSVELYDFYQQQIVACDAAIEEQLRALEPKGGGTGELPPAKKRKSKSSPNFDVRGELYRLSGVDLTRIDGMDETSVLKVVAETGMDMSAWPTEKHFSSWLGLSPGNKISGGKILNSKTKPSANRAAAAFRMSAYTLSRSNSALGAFYRRQRARLGAPKAITATAHKLARTVYSMLKNGSEYVDQGQDYYEKRYRERVTKNLKKRAAAMGFELVLSKADTNILDASLSTT
jgi:transposase